MRLSPETANSAGEAEGGSNVLIFLDSVRTHPQGGPACPLDYVADMAGQLAQLAQDGGHPRLAMLLALATDEARAAAGPS